MEGIGRCRNSEYPDREAEFAGGFAQSLCSSTVLKIVKEWLLSFCRKFPILPIPHGVEQQRVPSALAWIARQKQNYDSSLTLIRRGAEQCPRGRSRLTPNGSDCGG